MYIGGRGSGKTRSGGEWIAHRICTEPGSYALIVPTLDHGIVECLEENLYKMIPDEFRVWRGSVNQVDFANGSRLRLYHAMQPGKVRGPNLMGKWVDEPAEMRFGMDAWTNGQLATRIPRPNGSAPQTYVTGTPKRVDLMTYLWDVAGQRPDSYHVSNGTMRENIANLSPEIVEELEAQYGGTNLGMQELDGIMIEDVDGALLTAQVISQHRTDEPSTNASLRVMSVDPGFSSRATADEVGVVIGQRIGSGTGSIGEVLDDCSTRGTPGSWSPYLAQKCDEWDIDVIVFESNLVGQWVKETMVEALGKCKRMPRMESVLSRSSKWARAEPVGALAEKGRFRMVGTHAKLESELTSWVPNSGQRSPNRLDSWAQLGRYMLIKNVGGGGVGPKRTKRIGSIG
jgi:phage terminase large subunit-like protein